MSEHIDLSVRPTEDQVRRFRSLTASERYAWLESMLYTMHSLATEETKAQWRAMKQSQSGGFLSIVSAFAAALDRADFEGAARCLSPACRYESGSGTIVGIERIIASYRDNHLWAVQSFERIRYRSHVEATAAGSARITFEDLTDHRGLFHVYRCAQEVTVGRSKLVERIVHRELPGEREGLDAFFARAGIQSPAGG